MTTMRKQISADEARALRKDHLRDSAILKVAANAPSTWDEASRSARYVMSSQGVDRYGDIVVTAGLDTAEFERNSVAPIAHRSASWSIGSWRNLQKYLHAAPPRLEGTLALHPAGGPIPEVDQAAWAIRNGAIRGASIGFIPAWDQVERVLSADGSWGGGLRFNAASIVECSICSIPASPQSLVKSAGGDPRLARELIEYVLDNWRRSPAGFLISRAESEKAWMTVARTSIRRTPAQEEQRQRQIERRRREIAILRAET